MRELLLYFACKYKGVYQDILGAIKKNEPVDEEKLKEYIEKYPNYLTLLDNNYPEYIKNMMAPPLVLFYKGNINLINYPKIYAVIGTRKPDNYGVESTKLITTSLVEAGVCIASGLAKGIDSIAHRICIENNSPTIAFVANGLNKPYPSCNIQLYEDIVNSGGLILTEYPDDVEASSDKFNGRNRLIAAFSSKIVVTQAFPRSGTLLTVNHALFMNKEVYCIPDRITSNSVCNSLIKDGAKLVENAEEIIED